MEKDFLINLLLTLGVIGGVILLGGFLLLIFLTKRFGKKYINTDIKLDIIDSKEHSSFIQKISRWYLSKGALPFWYVFGIDCVILVYSQLMAAYLVLGGQVLVPLFWNYVLMAVCSLPFYYIGMKLFRSYETIVRFSNMEDLARIVCALFVGTVFVDVIKHFIPEDTLPVYPLWREQLVMLICAVILMWSVRILVKSLYDNLGQSKSRTRAVIFGTSMQSIEIGLRISRDNPINDIVLAFVRANDQEPYATIKEAIILNPNDDVIKAMKDNHVGTLIVPYSVYPDFFNSHSELIQKILENKMTITLQ